MNQEEGPPLPSTVIGRIDDDATTRSLLVTFVPTGRRYVYFDVPLETFKSFCRAFSRGSFFNTRVRDRYAREPVDDPHPSLRRQS